MNRISFILPAYNEEANIKPMVERIETVARQIAPAAVEIIFVDDHSTDATPDVLRALAGKNAKLRFVRLARRSGSHIAIVCGVGMARGDCAIVLAADGQDPPELAPEMIDRWREGNEVVWCVRRRYRRGWASTFCSKSFYWLMRHVSAVSLESQDADMVLLDRKVINILARVYERNMYLWGLIDWFGFGQTRVFYDKQERMNGTSGWTFMGKIKAAIDALVSFSYAPIRCMSLLGILFSTASCMLGLTLVANRITGGMLLGSFQVTGWASIICAVFFLGGLQILMLGVLGEYLWRTFDQVRGRPLYFVEEGPPGVTTADPHPRPHPRRTLPVPPDRLATPNRLTRVVAGKIQP